MNNLKLTVRDVLSRDSFKHAKVVAGKEGLDRQVKWSHVLEVKEFDALINGGEMILTTGVGLQLDLPSQLNVCIEADRKRCGVHLYRSRTLLQANST